VSVSVNEDWGETYTVRVYTANPLDESAEALCMAEGKVKSGETFSTNISVPSDLTTVFVERMDSHYRREVKLVGINDNSITTTFTNKGTETKAATRAITRAAAEAPYTSEQLEELMNRADAIDLTEITDIHNIGAQDGIYYVPAGKTVDWYWEAYKDADRVSESKLIIAGTVNYSGSHAVGNGMEVIIARGGVLNFNGNLTTSLGSKIDVLYGGTIQGTGNLTYGNATSSECYFGGDINIGDLNINGGELSNHGNLTVTAIIGSNGESSFINEGKVVTGEIEKLTYLENNCSLLCTGDANINNMKLGNTSQIVVNGDLKAGLGTWNLGDNSSVIADGDVNLQNENIVGPTNQYALLKFKNVTNVEWDPQYWSTPIEDGGYIKNNVYVEAESYHRNLPYIINGVAGSNSYVGNGNALLCGYGESQFIAVESECIYKAVDPEPEGNGTPTPDYAYCYYAFEDLGGTFDFDFNDVVLKVSETGTEGTYQIQAIAAGGTLPVAVKYDGKTIWDNIHGTDGYNDESVINVGVKVDKNFPTATITTTEPYNQLKNLVIYVQAKSSTNQTLSPTSVSAYTDLGEKPQCLIIPAGWKWPKEYFNIIDVYGVAGYSFSDWVQNAGSATGWYKNVAPGYESAVVDPATLK
jgi:hypothetical protein